MGRSLLKAGAKAIRLLEDGAGSNQPEVRALAHLRWLFTRHPLIGRMMRIYQYQTWKSSLGDMTFVCGKKEVLTCPRQISNF